MMNSSSLRKLLSLAHVQYKSTRPHWLSSIKSLQNTLAQVNIIINSSYHVHTIPAVKFTLSSLQIMQLLALFLLSVSAGALPQSSNLSPSETVASTSTLVNSTAPYTHEKRFDDPTLGNFDDPKCHGTHLGTKTTVEGQKCIQFTPTNAFIDIYWGQGEGQLQFYSSNDCDSQHKLKTFLQSTFEDHSCVSVAKFKGTVLSVDVPVG